LAQLTTNSPARDFVFITAPQWHAARMPSDSDTWRQLLAAGGEGAAEPQMRMRLLRKGGRPFLLFPSHGPAASAGLELYPAQRLAARVVRAGLRRVFRAGIFPGTTETMVPFSRNSPLGAFLIQTSGSSGTDAPLFCMLAGNPNAAGQRFIFLLMDESGAPRKVIKAGMGEHALKLLEQESAFLVQWGGREPGLPPLLGKVSDPRVGAFALPYFPPLSARTLTDKQIGEVLTPWLRSGPPVRLMDLPQWRRMEDAFGYHPSLDTLQKRWQGKLARPALYHGDFATWNVRTGADGLMVLDWERGEPVGPPAWDWFHYWVQHGLLVQRVPASELFETLRACWAGPAFSAYAQESGIAGLELELFLGYLLYIQRIIAPAEGKQGLRGLQNIVETALFNAG
jgi:hypothetical protein